MWETVSTRIAFGVAVVSHIIRSFCKDDPGVELLRSEIAGFRGEILRAEQTIRRSHEALDNCLSFTQIQSVFLRLCGFALVQTLVLIVVWNCQLCRRKRPDISQPAIVSSDSSEDSSPRPITDQNQVEQGVGVRSGPLRPSDLKRLAIEHHGFARAKVA